MSLAIQFDVSGISQIGYAELGKPGDKYSGEELVSVLRLNKTKTLQILALNKKGKGMGNILK